MPSISSWKRELKRGIRIKLWNLIYILVRYSVPCAIIYCLCNSMWNASYLLKMQMIINQLFHAVLHGWAYPFKAIALSPVQASVNFSRSYPGNWLCCLHNAPINVKPAGGSQGMGWGFDCLCWPWGRAFDWPCSPGGGNIWIFLCQPWDIWQRCAARGGEIWLHLTGMICPWAGNLTANFSKMSNPHPMPWLPPSAGLTLIGA